MKTVRQTGFSAFDGTQGKYGCIMACLATIFELPLEEAPNPYFAWSAGEDDQNWRAGWKVIEDWFAERGLRSWSSEGNDAPEGMWIALVDSKIIPGATHAIVFDDDRFVYDPAQHGYKFTLDDVRWVYQWEAL